MEPGPGSELAIPSQVVEPDTIALEGVLLSPDEPNALVREGVMVCPYPTAARRTTSSSLTLPPAPTNCGSSRPARSRRARATARTRPTATSARCAAAGVSLPDGYEIVSWD
ncbi:hypothetical protein GCM10020220_073310 [Nonomuraea rubra]|uniref:hypothetical protein n=1 Tax=Nonomuraea rubra TaxID=46180 RepID=UPI0031F0C6D0